MTVETSGNSNNSVTSEEIAQKQVLDKIILMRQEFEELLFLKYAAEILKNFRRLLLQERWD